MVNETVYIAAMANYFEKNKWVDLKRKADVSRTLLLEFINALTLLGQQGKWNDIWSPNGKAGWSFIYKKMYPNVAKGEKTFMENFRQRMSDLRTKDKYFESALDKLLMLGARRNETLYNTEGFLKLNRLVQVAPLAEESLLDIMNQDGTSSEYTQIHASGIDVSSSAYVPNRGFLDINIGQRCIPQSGATVTPKIDGLVLIWNNFECLCNAAIPATLTSIRLPVLFVDQQSASYTGVNFFKSEKIWTLQRPLFVTELGSVNLAIHGSEEVTFIKYSCVISCFDRAVFRTARGIPQDTQTAKHNLQFLLQDVRPEQNVEFAIYPSDLVLTMNKLIANFQNTLAEDPELPRDLVVTAFISNMGQSMALPLIMDKFNNIVQSNLLQCVVHVAYDIHLEKHTAFWRIEDVTQSMQYVPDTCYYAAGLATIANMVYKRQKKSVNKLPANIPKLQLYTQFLRNYKNLNPRPFYKPGYADLLLSLSTASASGCLPNADAVQLYIDQCMMLLRDLEKLTEQPSSGARCEVVIRKENCTEDTIQDLVAQAESYCEIRNLISTKHIEFLTHHRLRSHMREYYEPALRTILRNLSNYQNSAASYNLELVDYSSVLASEAIIGFYMCGVAVATSGYQQSRRHDPSLCKDIGLVQTAFYKHKVLSPKLKNIYKTPDSLVYHITDNDFVLSLIPASLLPQLAYANSIQSFHQKAYTLNGSIMADKNLARTTLHNMCLLFIRTLAFKSHICRKREINELNTTRVLIQETAETPSCVALRNYSLFTTLEFANWLTFSARRNPDVIYKEWELACRTLW